MMSELADTLSAGDTVVVIEWATAVGSILPADRLTILIEPDKEDGRIVTVRTGGVNSQRLWKEIQ